MACTLGRAVLPSPDSIRQEGGGRLRIGHSGYPFGGDEGLVMAQQILGYPNPDEEVVFFTYDASAADGVLDGAYFVAGTDVDWVKLAAGVFSWSAELVPVPSMTLPTFEVACLGDVRVNDHAFGVGTNSWGAFPGSALSRTSPKPNTGAASLVGGGTVDVFYDLDPFYDTAVTYAIEPQDAYEAAAELTVEGAVVTGRQTPRTSLGWVIENGLVRVRPSLTEANHFVVGIADSTGSTYQEYQYRLGYFEPVAAEAFEFGYDGSTRQGPIGIVVLRNSPECVSIRVVYPDHDDVQFDGGGTNASSSGYLDITLRRGQIYADCAFGLDGGTAVNLGVWRSVVDASASITGGVQDAAAVGGIKWQLYTPVTRTADNTNGGLYTTVAASDSQAFQFAVGNDRDVLGTGETLDAWYFAAQEHFQQAAGR